MSLSTIADVNWSGFQTPVLSSTGIGHAQRIRAALGATAGGVPRVTEKTLARYHKYLSANLSLPFTAYYPEPRTPAEDDQFRRTVLELLDPTRYLGDEFDGIFCRTGDDNFAVNLPLIELRVPENSSNSQLIEDYCYWFWNWR
jgi:hypothetical protein